MSKCNISKIFKDDKDDKDEFIAKSIIFGKSTRAIAISLDVDDRTVQIRWKKIRQRVKCETSEQAAAKLALYVFPLDF